MKKKTLVITLVLTILLSLMSASMAFASEDNEYEVEGLVIAIYPDEFKLEIEVDNEGVPEIIVVQVGQNFNFTGFAVGDLIEIKGIIDETGVVHVTELKIEEHSQEMEGEKESFYCTDEAVSHPLGLKLAANYSVDYTVLEGYLCGENPIPMGQIKLAVQTAALTGEDYTLYLEGFEGISWGQIWQELGLKGKPSHGIPIGQVKKELKEGDSEGKIPPGQLKKSGDFTPKGQLKKNQK